MSDPRAPQVPPPPQQASPRVPWGFLESVAVYACAFLVTMAALVAVQALAEAGMVRQGLGRAIFLPLTGIVLGVIAAVWVRARHGQSWRRLLGDRRPNVRDVLRGVGFGVGAWLVIVVAVGLLVRAVMGDDPPELQETFREMAADARTLPFLVFGAVLTAPIAEELFFRGMLFQAIRDRLGLWPGMGISSLLFTVVHMNTAAGQTANLLIFLIIFPLGILMAWLFERYRTLLVPVLVHAVFNAVQVSALIAGQGG